jgi:ectoine hydroxylase-related dioxygenase (phytanoyl-CoA dioxygenase family)
MEDHRMVRDSMQRLAIEGFVVLKRACSSELVSAILNSARQEARDVQAALGTDEIGIGSAAGYDEIVQRSPGRWDVPITPKQFGIDEDTLPWTPLIAAALGTDAERSFSGVVFSDPGSPAQYWHIDSPHEAPQHLAPHAFNVMLALHDVPRDMGPTEFARGSHILTNHLHNPSLKRDELVYQHRGTSPEQLVQDTQSPAPDGFVTDLAAGTCVVFDDRIMHRGLGNQSDTTRYMAYFSYRKKGYTENTHFESRRSIYDSVS